MTDEERQKLCADLYGIFRDEICVDDYISERCRMAADELERLAAELDKWKSLAESHMDPTGYGDLTWKCQVNPNPPKS